MRTLFNKRIRSKTGVSIMGWFKKMSGSAKEIKIAAHGIAEEHVYIDTMRCPDCGEGPVQREMHSFPCTWTVKCEACQSSFSIVSEESMIMTEEYLRVLDTGDKNTIRRYQRRYNHTDDQSNIIELTQWLTLASFWLSKTEEMNLQEDRSSGAYVSAEFHLNQSLQEALKFYPEDEEFPSRDAFFSERTYQHYVANKSSYSRSVFQGLLGEQRDLESIENDLERIETDG